MEHRYASRGAMIALLIALAFNGSAQTPGTPCDDGYACTTGDVYGLNCQCAGTPTPCVSTDPCTVTECDPATGDCATFPQPDTDGDGICDPEDDCPLMPGEFGSPCDDGNACTTDDVLMSDCTCLGFPIVCENSDPCVVKECQPATGICVTFPQPDTDGDGTCDPEDDCPLVPGEAGSPCDDGNACTTDDVLMSDCTCLGFPIVCENSDPCVVKECQPATGTCVTFPQPDTDGDGTCDPEDDCPLVPGEAGSPCDDGNACTNDDVLMGDCTCLGFPIVCENSDSCVVKECQPATGTCITFPQPDTDGDGTCDPEDDCPLVPGEAGSPCDDGNACTNDDVLMGDCTCLGFPIVCENSDPCGVKECQPATGTCITFPQPDTDGDGICDPEDDCPLMPGEFGSPCDDGNACTNDDVLMGDCTCVGFPIVCENTDSCSVAECDPATGTCVTFPIPDSDGDGICDPFDNCPGTAGEIGGPCDDGDACTWFDMVFPNCVCMGQALPCSDGDPCTLDQCIPSTGCTFPPAPDTDGDGICDATDACPLLAGTIGSPCDDGNTCTTGDAIDAFCRCTGTPLICDDLDPCTIDGCLTGSGCTHLPFPDSDDDGICDVLEYCAPCDDGNPCTFDLCNDLGDCYHTAIPDPDGDALCFDACPFVPGTAGSPCNDSTACTTDDVLDGYCLCMGTPVNCDDADPCTLDGCDAATGCTHDTIPDTDGDGLCDATDPCPLLAGPAGSPCDDGDGCTTGDIVMPGCSCKGFPIDCNDSLDCTIDACTGGVCTHTWLPDEDVDQICDILDPCPFTFNGDDLSCNDDDPCTENDVIDIMTCICRGTLINCDDSLDCTIDQCVGFECTHTWLPDEDVDQICDILDPCPFTFNGDDLSCNDDDPCTENDVIDIMTCICRGTLINCDDSLDCTIDQCVGFECTHTWLPDEDVDQICDILDPCPFTFNGDDLSCNDDDPCTENDVIDIMTCICRGTLINCDDSLDCTIDQCVGFECTHTWLPDEDVDQICDILDPCPFTFNGDDLSCNDDDPCTENDVIDIMTCICRGTLINCDDSLDCTIDQCVGFECTHTWLPDEDVDQICDILDPCPFTFNGDDLSCNDDDPCTENDVIDIMTCICRGTLINCDDSLDCTIDQCVGFECIHTPLPDEDGDGLCDVEDYCPFLPGIVGSPCDDNNVCTTDDVVTSFCICRGAPIDCDDGDPCTMDCCDALGGCYHTILDSDGDGTCDMFDVCTGGPEPGSACDDGDAGTTGDTVQPDCLCLGIPVGCDHDLALTISTDAHASETSWQIDPLGGGSSLCSGSGYPNNALIAGSCCLNDGCYVLSFFDSFGDGMCCAFGNGGYVLRDENGRRIIDNANDGAFGSTSSVALGFCVPLGTDQLTIGTCDREDLLSTSTIVANEDPAVSAQYGVTNATSGYQFWIFDPDGSYSRRAFLSHANPGNNGAPSGPTKACHLKLSQLVTLPVPPLTLLNVRVRGSVAGVYNEFGPTCRMKVDATAAACPSTQLDNNPLHIGTTYSCGVTGKVVNASGYTGKIYALPVLKQPGNIVACKYKFILSVPAEGHTRAIIINSYALTLGPWLSVPLLCGTFTYDVTVQASFDCTTYCTLGATCTVGITNPGGAIPCTAPFTGGGGNLNIATQDGGNLNLWPNPNRGDQLYVELSEVPQGVNEVTLDLYDIFGQRVMSRVIATDGGFSTVLDLEGSLADGLYMVNVTAGAKTYTHRLIIE